MIVSLSVSDFRSFSSEETFSLAASNKLSGTHDDHVVPIPNSDRKVLRIGAVRSGRESQHAGPGRQSAHSLHSRG